MSGALTDYSGGIVPGTTGQLDPGTPGGAGDTGVSLGLGTGQHGTQGVSGGLFGGNPFITLWRWLNTPFTTPMSPSGVFLLVGVVLVGILLWNLILYHIRIAAETI